MLKDARGNRKLSAAWYLFWLSCWLWSNDTGWGLLQLPGPWMSLCHNYPGSSLLRTQVDRWCHTFEIFRFSFMQSAYVGTPRLETSFMFSCMATHLLSSTMHSTLQDALASGTSRTEIRFSGLCHSRVGGIFEVAPLRSRPWPEMSLWTQTATEIYENRVGWMLKLRWNYVNACVLRQLEWHPITGVSLSCGHMVPKLVSHSADERYSMDFIGMVRLTPSMFWNQPNKVVQTYTQQKTLWTYLSLLLYPAILPLSDGLYFKKKKHAMDIQEASLPVIAHGGDSFP